MATKSAIQLSGAGPLGPALTTLFDAASEFHGTAVQGGGANKTKKTPIELLAAIVSGDKKVKSLGKGQLAKLASIDLRSLTYEKKSLAQLGLSKTDISEADWKALKKSLRGILSDDKVTKKELRGFKQETKSVLESTAFAKLEDQASVEPVGDLAVVPGLTQAAGRPVNVTGIGTMPLGFFGHYASRYNRRRVPEGVRATTLTGARGDVSFGQSLSRATVLGG